MTIFEEVFQDDVEGRIGKHHILPHNCVIHVTCWNCWSLLVIFCDSSIGLCLTLLGLPQ